MQRRLVSSIYAIRNTLYKRWQALQGLVDMLNSNPGLWKQRHKFDDIDIANIDDYDDLDDGERESLDNILADPKKFKKRVVEELGFNNVWVCESGLEVELSNSEF
jgi:hypothetical protein